MAKLPFVVQPRLQPITEIVGTEESGQIEIKRQGYLSVGEKAFATNAQAEDESMKLLLTFSKKVAAKYNIDLQRSYEAVMASITGNETEYSIDEDFGEELSTVMVELVHSEAKKKIVKAYSMLAYRINPELALDEVIELHPDLIEELAELYDDEEAKSVEKLESVSKSTPDLDDAEEASKK